MWSEIRESISMSAQLMIIVSLIMMFFPLYSVTTEMRAAAIREVDTIVSDMVNSQFSALVTRTEPISLATLYPFLLKNEDRIESIEGEVAGKQIRTVDSLRSVLTESVTLSMDFNESLDKYKVRLTWVEGYY